MITPPKRRIRLFDLETYRDYFLCKFQDYETGQRWDFPMWPGKPLDIAGVLMMIGTSTIVGFNSENYDCPILSLALTGATCSQLKDANDAIIVGKMKPWTFRDVYNCAMPNYTDHYDAMEVAPGVRISLKMYGGRAHSKRIQDLPFDPAASVSMMDRVVLAAYCGNDLETLSDVVREIMPRIELRQALTKQYNTDVRSKSDAQIAEAVFKVQLGFKPQRRFVRHGHQFYYRAPDFIKFQTPQLQEILQTVLTHPFTVSDKDQVSTAKEGEEVVDSDGKKIKTGILIPDAIKSIRVKIGGSVYKFGIGGLHSQEAKAAHYAKPGVNTLSDHDVISYYPSLILLLGMFPEQLGAKFIEIYRNVYDTRLSAKLKMQALQDAVDELARTEGKHWKTIADGLKIVLNGTFGKLFSKYSILFAPEQGIQVTITGQLCLLMLIEQLELSRIPVISANTDGIIVKTPCGMEWLRDDCIKRWERMTGLETEETQYTAVFSSNVNNYIAFKPDGKHKAKGWFGESGIMSGPSGKTPNREICADAVIAYLKAGTPLERTIRDCQDIRRFLNVRNVKGGGIKRTPSPFVGTQLEPFESPADQIEDLGKVARWYYGVREKTGIYYKTNGNLVADSMGAVPMMELKDGMPADLDYAYYIRHAQELLADLGVV